jgi:DNA-binding NtrC family response regulator
MLTAYGAVETYLKSLSLGIFEYVNKPVRAKDLGRVVKSALALSEDDNIAPGNNLSQESPSFRI